MEALEVIDRCAKLGPVEAIDLLLDNLDKLSYVSHYREKSNLNCAIGFLLHHVGVIEDDDKILDTFPIPEAEDRDDIGYDVDSQLTYLLKDKTSGLFGLGRKELSEIQRLHDKGDWYGGGEAGYKVAGHSLKAYLEHLKETYTKKED